MNREETVKILTLCKLAYPTYMEKLEADGISAMADIWQRFFADDTFNLVELAVQRHISTSKYFPSIAEIRTHMARLMRPDLIQPEQAWAILHDYYFTRYTTGITLPELIYIAVDNEGSYIKEHINDGLGRKCFLEHYKPLYEKELERACLPKVLRDRIDKGNNYLGGATIKQIAEIKKAAEAEKIKREEEDHSWDFIFGEKEEPGTTTHIQEAWEEKARQTRAKYANL